jgi:DNA invertase Pin-like site-specific DNA recombinase
MEETNLKNRFVAYYRVSTEKQDLDTQKFVLSHYLPESYICAEFCEIESGKHMSTNEELYAAVEYCKENDKILAVSALDRVGRDAEHALKIHRELDGWMYACNIPVGIGERMDRLMLTLFMAFAEKERELTSLRTKQALAKRKSEGVKLGAGSVPKGKKMAEKVHRARRTRLQKRFGDPNYHKARDFIMKRVDAWVEKEGKPARKYWSRNFDDIYYEVAEELNMLNVPVPNYLNEREKWLSRQVFKIYEDESKKVGLRYQLEVLDTAAARRLERENGRVLGKKQDLLKSS